MSDEPDALVFTGPKDAALRRGTFNPRVRWTDAVDRVGMPGLHFHDLRHTGNTLAAATGASMRDLMVRMGHDSINAAIIYQHAINEAGRAIANRMDSALRAKQNCSGKRSRRPKDDPDGGADGALVQTR